MSRPNKPWYWKARKAWFTKIDGRRVKLGTTKAEANQRFHELMAEPSQPVAASGSIGELAETFLDWVMSNRSEGTYQWYVQRLSDFCRCVSKRADQVKPSDLSLWLETKDSDGHKNGCARAVVRLFNWGMKNGHLKSNPIAGFEKPSAGKRVKYVTEEEFKRIIELASDQNFRDLIEFSYLSGARPQETYRIEARHFDEANSRLVIPVDEAKGKRKVRVIYLPGKSLEIIQRLKEDHPSGPLFRNARGEQWKRNNVACRFKRMSKKLGRQVSLYECRHAYATAKLMSGVDPLTTALLLGHSNPAVLATTYQHVAMNPEHMLKQAEVGATS